MNAKDIETLIGIPYSDLSRIKRFEVVAFLGDETESVGSADTIEDALLLLRPRVIDDDTWQDDDHVSTVEDAQLRPMAIALSEAFLMERLTDLSALNYLAQLIEERPELRLVVAWEAIPHLHDVAFGIFTRD